MPFFFRLLIYLYYFCFCCCEFFVVITTGAVTTIYSLSIFLSLQRKKKMSTVRTGQLAELRNMVLVRDKFPTSKCCALDARKTFQLLNEKIK